MKNLVRTTTFLLFSLVFILACTKDIALKTEVEFKLVAQHTAEGYINEDLTTTVTVIPEAELEELSYSYSYSVSKGEGYFKDGNGVVFPQNEKIDMNPLTATLMYVGSKSGEHFVKVTASDNYGFSEEVDIDYFLIDAPSAVWTATSTVQRIALGNSATITVSFVENEANSDMEYERNYSFISGSGELTALPSESTVRLNEFEAILPGTYEFQFTPAVLGISELSFLLRDGNGEELIATVTFEVSEIIEDTVAPVITILGDNPVEVTRGDTYFDLGASALDDVDGDISQNILVDASGVDMTTAGTYQVTYNVSDASGNAAAEMTRTVSVVANVEAQEENDILAFALPGQVEASIINTIGHTVTANLPFGTDINAVPLALTISPNATITPSPDAQQNFANPVTYTVTDGNGIVQEWVVTVNVGPSSEKSIENFEIDGVTGVLSGTAISLTLPAGTDSASLAPNIMYTGASISPESGNSVDFTDPVTYTVTAEDGSTLAYTVTVMVEESDEKEIQTFSIAGTSGVFSGPDNTRITVTLPAGTDEMSLRPTIVHTGESINPQSGMPLDFTDPVAYTVTAENNSQLTYTVMVIVEGDAPVASASADMTTTFVNQDINFTGSLSTDDIRIDSYAWDFGDGNTSTSPNPVHRYSAYDDFTVTLLVTDDGGLTDTVSFEISVINQAPVAIASANRLNISPGQSVNFTGSGSTDDLAVTSHDWDFGNSQGSSSADTSHTYTCAGTYVVTLTVSDAEGLTDNTTITINVTAPSSVSFNASSGTLSGPSGASVRASISMGGIGNASLNGPGASARVCRDDDGTCPYPSSESITFTIPECGTSRVSASVSAGGDTPEVTATVIINGVSYTIRRGDGIPSN